MPLIAENLADLDKRLAQMQYPTFQAQGWPIGSGIVERANKLVVEARLKGAGMHWSRASVNPLLALRNAVCNDRWAEAWQQRVAHIQREGISQRPVQPKSAAVVTATGATPAPSPLRPVTRPTESMVQHKPAADHPWRRKNNATKANIAQTASPAKV